MGILTALTSGSFDLALGDGGVLPVMIAGGDAGGLPGAAAYTPNTEQSFGPVTPGGSARVLAVADITPRVSGLLSIRATVAVASSAPDAVNLAMFAVAPMTAITGGTPVGVGITLNPTSTTPVFSGTPIMSTLGVESTVGGNLAGVTITGTFQAVIGQRTGIVLTGLSAVGGATTWVVGITFEVLESPGGTGATGPGTVQSVTAAAPASSGIVVTNPTTNPTLAFAPGFGPPTLYFATVASMAAYNVATPTTLVQGQEAFVLSSGSVWNLKLVSALTVGNTVQNATGVAGAQWLRSTYQQNVPAALKQSTWFIDPQNVSGTASDENSGLDATHALVNKREIFRRWGFTWTPNLVGPLTVVITYMSADLPGSTDPGLFAPNFINGATLTHTAALPASSFTGTLLAVTAKNTGAGNTALRSTFTTATGAMAVGLLLVNATRGNSRAFAQRNTGGGTWQITQPFVPYVLGGFANGAEVNTWANGDAITGYALLPVDLAAVAGQTSLIAGAPSHVAWQLDIFDPSAAGGIQACEVGSKAFFAITECHSSRLIAMSSFGTLVGTVYNCFIDASFIGRGSSRETGPIVGGGCITGQGGICFFSNCIVGTDIILASQGETILEGASSNQSNICLDTGCTLTVQGQCNVRGGVSTFYGAGVCNVAQNLFIEAGTAVNAIRCTVQLNGVATAYGNLTAAGATTVFNRALTPAAIDAASGLATGFGGYAYGGGATISKAGVQP